MFPKAPHVHRPCFLSTERISGFHWFSHEQGRKLESLSSEAPYLPGFPHSGPHCYPKVFNMEPWHKSPFTLPVDVCWVKQRPHQACAPSLRSLRFSGSGSSVCLILARHLRWLSTDKWLSSPGKPVSTIDLTKRSTRRWSTDLNRFLAIPLPKSNLYDT